MLTPNWLSRLPGWTYAGGEPDGFMTAAEFVDHLSAYARSFDAPVRDRTAVLRLERDAAGFVVHTDRGRWASRNVVVATGYHSRSKVPDLADRLAPDVLQLTASGYRSPSGVPGGGVLVVGASATGAQIAHELVRAGHPVHLAVGCHTRLPRRYRDRDILWWLERMGTLDRSVDDVPDIEAARVEPSLQLAGTADPRGYDLGVLRDAGVRLTGRLRAAHGRTVEFADDLTDTVTAAQRRLRRVLDEIDAYAAGTLGAAVAPPDPPPAIAVPATPSRMDLRRAGIATVIWATGYRPWYPWLALPVLDPDGRIRHRRGVTDIPGLYAIGLRWQSRRSSTFVDGARHDAAYVADHVTAGRTTRLAV